MNDFDFLRISKCAIKFLVGVKMMNAFLRLLRAAVPLHRANDEFILVLLAVDPEERRPALGHEPVTLLEVLTFESAKTIKNAEEF